MIDLQTLSTLLITQGSKNERQMSPLTNILPNTMQE
jgi:hypothetical protein